MKMAAKFQDGHPKIDRLNVFQPLFSVKHTINVCTSVNFQGMLVRSIRESNFISYVDILMQVCPWMFALDHVHYARWLSVFIHSLQELPQRHLLIYKSFLDGHFTSKKTAKLFSAMAEDQLHEQNNKLI